MSKAFQDMDLKCMDCGREFSWTAGEQEFYAKMKYTQPKRCKGCRERKRQEREESPAMWPVVLLVVGLLLTVPARAQTPCAASSPPTPGAPKVCVSWTAPTPVTGVTVAGYNVFRATVAKGENYATPLNSTPVTALFFADTTDAVGTTYFYTVTAVSTGGVQSVPSSEVSAQVPVPPGQALTPGATPY